MTADARTGPQKLPVEQRNGGSEFVPPLLVNSPGRLPVFSCSNASQAGAEYYRTSSQCASACDGSVCLERQLVNMSSLEQEVASSYTDYVDVIMSEALRDYSSVDTESPLRLQVRSAVLGWCACTRLHVAYPRVRCPLRCRSGVGSAPGLQRDYQPRIPRQSSRHGCQAAWILLLNVQPDVMERPRGDADEGAAAHGIDRLCSHDTAPPGVRALKPSCSLVRHLCACMFSGSCTPAP